MTRGMCRGVQPPSTLRWGPHAGHTPHNHMGWPHLHFLPCTEVGLSLDVWAWMMGSQEKTQLLLGSCTASCPEVFRAHKAAPPGLRRGPSVCTSLPVGIGDITWHFARVILIKPAIRQCLLNIGPLHRIWFQERAQEVDGAWEDIRQTNPCYRLNADAAETQGRWPTPSPESLPARVYSLDLQVPQVQRV